MKSTMKTIFAVAASIALNTPFATGALAAEHTRKNEVTVAATASQVYNRTVEVDGVKIFYREAGNPSAPTIVLLHGFPSSSHSFRNLIPELATRFHVIAPDYPGYGYSDAPARDKYAYTFDHLAQTMDSFLQKVGASSYIVYMHDFGGPVGYRIATAHPERVRGLVVQNANAHEEGLSPAFGHARELWANRNAETEAHVRGAFSPEGIKWQYVTGANDPATMTRDGYSFDAPLMQRPGQDGIQLDLLENYKSNLVLYPQWQKWLKTAQPKTLIVWGAGDPLFTVEGAHAVKREVPAAKLVTYKAGHFLLEEYSADVAKQILLNFDAKRNVK